MNAEPHSHPALLCYDGSESAAAAIAVAARLLIGREAVACHTWAGLSKAIFHSDPSELPGTLVEAAEELDAFDRQAAESLAGEGARLASEAGFRAEALAVREHQKTWRTLLRAADQREASVIVTGAHGLSGVGRLLLGSVSNAVVHHSRRPVLLVPAETPQDHDGPLLLCYDGSESAARTIRAAGELCRPRRAVVLNLWGSWVPEAPVLAGVARPVNSMTAELDEIAHDLSGATVGEGLRLAAEAGFDAEPVSTCAAGALWKSLLDIADEHDTEVTVLVRSQLARREEPEVAECIHDAFVADGIAVVEGAQPTEVRRHGDQVVVLTHDGEFRAEQLLVATGRQPNLWPSVP